MPLDSSSLRKALGRYATGVTVITCRDAAGQRIGLTANSFNALSLEPPLVLWALRTASPNLPAFSQASHFAVNVLTQTQLDVSQRFASPVPDRFAIGEWQDGAGGAPMLQDCTAVLVCRQVQQLQAGDHVLFIGEVESLSEEAAAPLLYHAGQYRSLGDTVPPAAD